MSHLQDGEHNVTLVMPDEMPDSDEAYLCSAFRVKDWMGIEPMFIQGFLVNASNRMLHHMIIQACGPLDQQPGEVW